MTKHKQLEDNNKQTHKKQKIAYNNSNNFDEEMNESSNDYQTPYENPETSTNIPPLLIINAKEFKDNPKLLKQTIKEDLNGIEIKQIKFTKNDNMLLYLKNQYQYNQLTDENTNAKFAGKNFTCKF